ncbi:MAG: DUF2029 domain-containing protein [Acidobacteriota bacterium]|nr:DUF2029 domain-containing protein [Acidobacteriota bacterium]
MVAREMAVSPRTWRLRVAPWAVAVAVSLLAAVLLVRQLTVPEYLEIYDSGVYFGAAIHLLSGAMPYRDFTFVQPPGIVVLLAPAALVWRVVGPHAGFYAARAMAALAAAANAGLLAWLVRRWGRVAMAVAGVALVTLPVAIFSDISAKLEPFTTLFALLGAIALTGGPAADPPSRRRLVVAGVLFGLAASVKLVGLLPLGVAVLALAWTSRRRALTLAASGVAALVAVCLPFFLAAPGAFLSQVIGSQFSRAGDRSDSLAVVVRLGALTGQSWFSLEKGFPWPYVAWALIVVVLVAGFWRARRAQWRPLFLLATAVVTSAALLAAPYAYVYYFYFTAPFLIAAVVIATAELVRPLSGVVSRLRHSVRVLCAGVLLVAGLGVTYDLYWRAANFNSVQSWAFGAYGPWIDQLDGWIPPGACVAYSEVGFGVYAGRLLSSHPNCPVLVDTYGEWLPYGVTPLNHPRHPAALERTWREVLGEVQYAVLSMDPGRYPYGSANIPWTPALRSWFTVHYRLVHRGHYFLVFHHLA